jgi:cystathionine beta-lyase
MKKYDFDEIVDRHHTGALKIDAIKERWHRDDLLPMWVADMDFKTPPFIMDALTKRCQHPILGYTMRPDAWYDTICCWTKQRYGWNISRKNVGFVPGVVTGIAHALKCFTSPGDKVLIQPPVYHPFRMVVKANQCELVNSQLAVKDERFYIDFDRFTNDIKGCKAFILCNPHNPGGRVWSREELERIAHICYENHVLVLSDEIHCDLTYSEYTHIPFASVSLEAAQNSITFMAPSKTFNCAGLGSSQYIIINEELGKRYGEYLENNEMNEGHLFAYIPVLEAFTPAGKEWLDEALEYIQENVSFTQSFLHKHMPLVDMMVPEASYLIFIDFRKLGLSQTDLVHFIEDEVHLALNSGTLFGPGGEGFMRLNAGTPRSILEQALNQLNEAYNKRF